MHLGYDKDGGDRQNSCTALLELFRCIALHEEALADPRLEQFPPRAIHIHKMTCGLPECGKEGQLRECGRCAFRNVIVGAVPLIDLLDVELLSM